MADWRRRLDAFLEVNEHEILTHAGRVSHEEAVGRALSEYERFDASRRAFEASHTVSDFDQLIEESRRLEEPPP